LGNDGPEGSLVSCGRAESFAGALRENTRFPREGVGAVSGGEERLPEQRDVIVGIDKVLDRRFKTASGAETGGKLVMAFGERQVGRMGERKVGA
jgi:hypothetical protein